MAPCKNCNQSRTKKGKVIYILSNEETGETETFENMREAVEARKVRGGQIFEKLLKPQRN